MSRPSYADMSLGTSTTAMLPAAASGDGATAATTSTVAPPSSAAVTWRTRAERWIVLAIVSTGALLAAVQSSALVIAFPTLIVALQADIATILWVLLSFLLVVSAIVPVVGKLGDIVGQAVLYNTGFAIFTLASLLSGFSQPSAHGNDLIFYRCLLGIGASFLFTNSSAIVTNMFAPYNQVGLSQGVFQLAFALGSVLGPVIGGGFADVDWRWIFWINVPIGFVCTVLASWLVRDSATAREARLSKRKPWQQHLREFDLLGGFFCIAAILLLMLALTQAVLPTPGLSSTAAIVCLVVFGVAALVAFVITERFAFDPLIPGAIWRSRVFTLSTVAATLMAFARANVTYALIFFLQGPYGQDPLTAGIQLIPMGVGIILVGMPAGRVADKYGVRNLATLGSFVVICGLFGLAFITAATNYWLIAFALFVVGIGNGFFNAPNGLAGMTSIPPNERGVAAAVRLLFSFVPQMVGIVIVFALILNSLTYAELLDIFINGGGGNLSADAIASFMRAYQDIFWITISTTAIATACNALIPAAFRPADAIKQYAADAAAAKAAAAMEDGAAKAAIEALGSGAKAAHLDMRPSEAVLSGIPTEDAELAVLGKTTAM